MRMSCNGCRVLRKGCTDDCTIRPCLQWIKSPDSQANATLFLAKFYGRAGLINLIEAGPPQLRPALFRSLLYEACGRIVNPVYGSVGLLWSGNWGHCQEAVDAVLKGSPTMQMPSLSSVSSPPFDETLPHPIFPLKTCDIRHLSKEPNPPVELNKVKTRTRFKKLISRPNSQAQPTTCRFEQVPSSWLISTKSGNRDDESRYSVETVEGNLANQAESEKGLKPNWQVDVSHGQMGLDLTLGLLPM